ncbi:MAG TPA: hypothetical protein VHL77_04390 [Ferruginibacter sp.]|jgi:hypothetical protein|nr:hypothetical protein [Ferruginibacter sp.]
MKLRIKGNSLRIRLTKTEVSTLANTGHLEEQTVFPSNTFKYVLQKVDDGTELSATFTNDTITMYVPASFVNSWPGNEVVGINTNMPLPGTGSLYLLLEKDFICLDETTEDQSDNYENPNKTC